MGIHPSGAQLARSQRALKQRDYERRYQRTPRGQYTRHKANAKRRGLMFTLSFEEWWGIWERSGKWKRRGNSRGRYCMMRIGDRGGYTLGNVIIGTWSANTAECNRTRHEPDEAPF